MILFIYKNLSTFVKNDLNILENKYRVKKFKYNTSKILITNLINQIRIIRWLFKNIKKTKIIYIWFAEYHSLLPIIFGKVFNKKTYLIIGGYDVGNIPELEYGAQSTILRKFFSKLSMKFATLCLPVSKYIDKRVYEVMGSINTQVIYNGVNMRLSVNQPLKDKIFLTVGNCKSMKRIRIKGIDRFIKLANFFPEYQFIVIGISNQIQNKLKYKSNNITIYPKMPHKKLIEYYRRAMFYCQFSRVEAFGLSVLEALCYHSIPIISNQGALPELYSDVGLVVNITNIESIVKKIRTNIELLNFSKQDSTNLIKQFSISSRARKLYRLIK